MIKIGFFIPLTDQYWIGGLNYYKNLFSAIYSNASRKIEPVVFTGRMADLTLLDEFPPFEIIQTSYLDVNHQKWIIRKLLFRIFSYDILFENYLLKYNIKLFSHSIYIGKKSKIKTIGWIPDFQHLHLPDLFSKNQLKERKKLIELANAFHTRIIVSSDSAKKDLENVNNSIIYKTRTLNFVADVIPEENLYNLKHLEKKYLFRGKYFYVPNQFWVHKNHKVVIQAISLLKEQNIDIQIIFSGNTEDHRNPSHFLNLMKYAKECGIYNSIKTLGIIPLLDVYSFIFHSISIINPSLFEGWSSTVEEAKSYGKIIILSDINVHREQAPERGLFFDPFSPIELAKILLNTLASYDRKLEHDCSQKSLENLSRRLKTYARDFEKIALNVNNEK